MTSNNDEICTCGHRRAVHGEGHVQNVGICDQFTVDTSRPQPPATPMCDRLNSVHEDMMQLDDFLEFAGSYGLGIDFSDAGEAVAGAPRNLQELVYRYFEIDRLKLEQERRALLNYQRELNAKNR
jgi:hypothetical protein